MQCLMRNSPGCKRLLRGIRESSRVSSRIGWRIGRKAVRRGIAGRIQTSITMLLKSIAGQSRQGLDTLLMRKTILALGTSPSQWKSGPPPLVLSARSTSCPSRTQGEMSASQTKILTKQHPLSPILAYPMIQRRNYNSLGSILQHIWQIGSQKIRNLYLCRKQACPQQPHHLMLEVELKQVMLHL